MRRSSPGTTTASWRPLPSGERPCRRWRSCCSRSSWRWRCSSSWARASPGSAYTTSDDFPVLRALGTSARAAVRGRAGPGGAGRGGRDGAGDPDRLRAVGVHADRAGAPGGDLPRVLVQRRDPAGRGGRPCAAACRPGSDHGAAGDEDPHRHARGSRLGAGLHGQRGGWPAAGFPPTAVSGVRLAFEPGRDRTAVPVRSAIFGMAVALAAVMAAAGVRVQPGPRHR